MKQTRNRVRFILPGLVLLIASLTEISSQVPAFPGAEGHARYVTGGRGGAVYVVSNLNDNGPGSLRAAVEASGPRTVVFQVSGTIQLESRIDINNDSITIAGQTAPGDGITLRDYPVVVNANNVIIRFIRFRMGDETDQQADALEGRFHKNILIDHCSMSWSTDECVTFYQNETFTLQWCIVAESLRNSVHEKGAHGYGGIWGGRNASFHHNLMAHHSSRNPRLGEYRGSEFALTDLVDLRNNVIYNWGGNSCYGGEAMNVNIVNCYYKPGPATTTQSRIVAIDKLTDFGFPITDTWGKFYIDGNVMTASERATEDNWTYGVYNQINSAYGILTEEEKAAMRLSEPLNPGEVTTHTAEEAYELVMEHGGASLFRDSVDLRIIHDARTGTATYMDGGNGSVNGIIDTQEAVGGWPELASVLGPADTDSDGMPDAWEEERGLDPEDPEDRNGDRIGDGYTNLEEYLNSRVTIPWDLEPMLMVYSPGPGSGYLPGDTVEIEALSGAYGQGGIESFELHVDGALVYSTDTTLLDTILTGLETGAHLLAFTATDSRGNSARDSVKIFMGTERYRVSLLPGSGEGEVVLEPEDTSYVEGTELTLFADPAFSYSFQNWTGDVSSSENPLMVTVDRDLEITVNYSRDTGTYARINFQPAESEVPAGYLPDVGAVIGPRESGLTYGWVGTYNEESIQRAGVDDPRKATFNQMQKNGDVSWEFALPEGSYAVFVHMGDGRLTSQVNSISIEGIDLADTIEGNYFDEFYLDSVEVTDGALTLVPTGEDAKINFIKIGSAGWQFGRFITVFDGKGDGDYPVGSGVVVTANPSGTNYAFLTWSGDSAYVEDVRSPETTLVMPDQDLVLRANYWIPIYTLTINSGTGSGQYETGSQVPIAANTPPEGQEFEKWVVVSGDTTSLSATENSFAWVTMPGGDLEITATYRDITGVGSHPDATTGLLQCYPNPAGDEFFIKLDNRRMSTVRIFDYTGRMVFTEVIHGQEHRVDARLFSPGIYHVQVTDELGKEFSIKLVKN